MSAATCKFTCTKTRVQFTSAIDVTPYDIETAVVTQILFYFV